MGGILSYLLLSANVILGLLSSLRLTDSWLHRANVVYLHKILSLTTLVFTALHLVGLLLDPYLQMTLAQSLVPFANSYRPVWVGLGTLSLYAIIAVVSSFYLAEKFGYRFWRRIHYVSFELFATSGVHGFMAGSDTRSGWMQLIYLVTGFSVVFLIGLRFTNGRI